MLVESTHKNAFVIVSEYVVFIKGLTAIEEFVSPVLHKNEPRPKPSKMVVSPKQISVSPVMLGNGLGFTVIIIEAVFSQLLASVTVTKYVVVSSGETVISDVVAPLFHSIYSTYSHNRKWINNNFS